MLLKGCNDGFDFVLIELDTQARLPHPAVYLLSFGFHCLQGSLCALRGAGELLEAGDIIAPDDLFCDSLDLRKGELDVTEVLVCIFPLGFCQDLCHLLRSFFGIDESCFHFLRLVLSLADIVRSFISAQPSSHAADAGTDQATQGGTNNRDNAADTGAKQRTSCQTAHCMSSGCCLRFSFQFVSRFIGFIGAVDVRNSLDSRDSCCNTTCDSRCACEQSAAGCGSAQTCACFTEHTQ